MKINKQVRVVLCTIAALVATCPMSAHAVETVINEETLTKEYSSAVGSVSGVTIKEDGAAVNQITHTVKEGAEITELVGGISISPQDYKNDVNLTNDTLKGGVVINVEGGTITNTVYGGNMLTQPAAGKTLEETVADLGDKVNAGSIQINVKGGSIGTIGGGSEAIMGGGGRHCGTKEGGSIEVNISGGTINNLVYAGTNGGSTQNTILNVSGGTINSDIYGAGRKAFGVVENDTNVTISGGHITGNVYGGGNEDTVKGNTNVTITGGTIGGTVYGGGSNGAKVVGDRNLTLAGGTGSSINPLTVADFTSINVAEYTSATLESLTVADRGTALSIASGATLSIGELIVTGREGHLTWTDSYSGTQTLGIDAFTIVLTQDMLSTGGEQTITLIEGGFQNMLMWYYLMSPADVRFVLEDGSDYYDVEYTGIEWNQNSDFDLQYGPMGAGAVVIKATILPEPATATLSLLALAGLAARRRRR